MKNKTGTVLVFFAAVFYSLGGLGFKLIETWNAFSINGVRTFIGALVVLLFMAITKRKIKLTRSVFLGALCVMGTNALFAVANKLTTAANTIVLQFTAPIFVILICWLVWKRRPQKLDVIACAVVFAGVLCFMADSLEMGGMLGNLLALLSGVSYAGVFLLNDLPNGDSLSSIVFGFLGSVLIGIPFVIQETDFSSVTITALLILGVFQVGLAYIFIALGTKITPPVTACLVSGIEPVLNPILVAIFYPAEKVGSMAIVGTLIVVVGVVTYNIMKEKFLLQKEKDDMQIYDELVARGLIAQVTDEDGIREMVNNGKATFYIGFDPTADSLHVGHFMALCLMKRLQMAGNKPIALIGGGTAMIGDPSGRTDMRSMMTKETIQHNCNCFKKQMERFIEFGEGKAQMVNNADWLLDLNYVDVLREVGACFSVNNMLRAECYKQRMEKGLSFLEFNYMIMQSYDFYYLFQHYGCNMQFGGNDQWSNMLGGTELIRRKLGKDAQAMTITLLLNSEGKKMGKTASGAVWLDPNKTSPFDFYQYWRNVGDDDVLKCIRMLTFLPLEQIDEMDKWEGAQLNKAKEILAYELTALVHGAEEAQKAEAAAKALFAGGNDDSNMPTTTVSAEQLTEGAIGILDLLTVCGLIPSRGEGRRLVQQGGVTVDDNKITSIDEKITAEQLTVGVKIRKGKKVFHKAILG